MAYFFQGLCKFMNRPNQDIRYVQGSAVSLVDDIQNLRLDLCRDTEHHRLSPAQLSHSHAGYQEISVDRSQAVLLGYFP